MFESPWYFRSCANLSDVQSTDTAILEFEGVNYRANVWVNDILVATSDTIVGPFRRFGVDVSSAVTENDFACVVVEVFRATDDYWTRNATDLAISVIDWSADSPDRAMGLILPVTLRIDSGVRLRYPSATLASWEESAAILNVAVNVENDRTEGLDVSLAIHINMSSSSAEIPSFLVSCATDIFLEPGESSNLLLQVLDCPEFQVSAADVQGDLATFLWWPWQMGTPLLQSLSIAVTSKSVESGELATVDSVEVPIGLRLITADLDANGHRLFTVNSKRLLIRGGGYAQDLLLQSSASRDLAELLHVRNLNLNTVRFEGKFPPESLFDLMDALGLLALPGVTCCDAWQNWDLWPSENSAISEDSLASQFLRLRRHPCAAGFFLSSDEVAPAEVEAAYRNAAAAARWPNPLVPAAAEGTSAVVNESTGVKMLGPYAWVPPNYWSDPEALERYGGPTGFSTEISPGASPLTLESWLKTVDPGEAWCPSDGGPYADVWNFHCGNEHGVFRSLEHFVPPLQLRYGGTFVNASTAGSGGARPPKALNTTTTTTFPGGGSRNSSSSSSSSSGCGSEGSSGSGSSGAGVWLGKDGLAEFLAKSQVAAYEAHRAMFESYSGAKYNNATGVVQWMLNNGLPQHIWHLFDSYLDGGGAYYGAQRGNELLHAQYDAFDGGVRVVNSRYSGVAGGAFEVRAARVALNGTELTASTFPVPGLDPDSVARVGTLGLNASFAAAKRSGGVVLVRLDLVRTTTARAPPPPPPPPPPPGGTLETPARLPSSAAAAAAASFPFPSLDEDPKPNTYWVSSQPDVVNWTACNFYVCNLTSGANFTALGRLPPVKDALVAAVVARPCSSASSYLLPPPKPRRTRLSPLSSLSLGGAEGVEEELSCTQVNLTNTASDVVAFHVHVRLFEGGEESGIIGGGRTSSTGAIRGSSSSSSSVAAYWDDNFVTLMPRETRILQATTIAPVSNPRVVVEAFNDAISA